MRKGALAGALAAAAVSAGLAWWLAASPDRALTGTEGAPEPVAAAASPARLPDAEPSPEQVRRAYEQVGDVYANGGVAAVERFARTCAESVAADPRVLDFCLAFDIYGSALRPPDAPEAILQREALAQAALPPGEDAAARVEAVRALTGVRPRPPAPAEAKVEPMPVRKAVAKASKPKKAAPAPSNCRFMSTPADRAICANPSLRAAERRMQAAYSQALAGGANRRSLARDQARWRVEVHAAADDRRKLAALLAERTRELRARAARRR